VLEPLRDPRCHHHHHHRKVTTQNPNNVTGTLFVVLAVLAAYRAFRSVFRFVSDSISDIFTEAKMLPGTLGAFIGVI